MESLIGGMVKIWRSDLGDSEGLGEKVGKSRCMETGLLASRKKTDE